MPRPCSCHLFRRWTIETKPGLRSQTLALYLWDTATCSSDEVSDKMRARPLHGRGRHSWIGSRPERSVSQERRRWWAICPIGRASPMSTRVLDVASRLRTVVGPLLRQR